MRRLDYGSYGAFHITSDKGYSFIPLEMAETVLKSPEPSISTSWCTWMNQTNVDDQGQNCRDMFVIRRQGPETHYMLREFLYLVRDDQKPNAESCLQFAVDLLNHPPLCEGVVGDFAIATITSDPFHRSFFTSNLTEIAQATLQNHLPNDDFANYLPSTEIGTPGSLVPLISTHDELITLHILIRGECKVWLIIPQNYQALLPDNLLRPEQEWRQRKPDQPQYDFNFVTTSFLTKHGIPYTQIIQRPGEILAVLPGTVLQAVKW